MYLIAIAWMYVVLMMALAEAFSPQGTVLGAAVTLLLYGVMPLSLLLYILGTPLRRRRASRLEAEQSRDEARSRAEQGNTGSHAPAHTQAPIGKKP